MKQTCGSLKEYRRLQDWRIIREGVPERCYTSERCWRKLDGRIHGAGVLLWMAILLDLG
jgi:hypothetical protein